MELRHLRYFLAVAEELNFRRAGDRLHISHPALSKQIRDLEHSLGAALLERNTVSVRLTPAGRLFMREAEEILARVKQAMANIGSLSRHPKVITIGTQGPLGKDILSSALARFSKKHKNVDIQIIDNYPNDQLKALLRGEILLGFVPKLDANTHTSIKRKLLLRSAFEVILGKNHPLARRRLLRCNDLVGETFFYVGDGRTASRHLEDLRARLPKNFLKTLNLRRVESSDSLITLLSSGLGGTLLPAEFVAMRRDQLCHRPLLDARETKPFELWIIWRSKERSPFLNDLLQSIAL